MKLLMLVILVVGFQQLTSCSNSEPQKGIFIQAVPNTIPLNEYFGLDIGLFEDKYEHLRPQNIKVEAVMITHGHGMNVEPQVEVGGSQGHFVANGLLFHMKGEWQIFVYVDLGSRTEKITLNAQL